MTEANTTTTSYAYDTLNDLTLVCQGAALVSGLCPSGTQSRAFVYDSLARLKSATNPESGTTSYTYDYNGNLTYKTDSNGNDTTLAYDALNRITFKDVHLFLQLLHPHRRLLLRWQYTIVLQ